MSSSSPKTLKVETPAVFVPLLEPARYCGLWGGRGSGKSHFFAELLVEAALAEPSQSGEGLRAVCIREVQKTLKESAKRLIESKLSQHRLGEADGFKVYEDRIAFPRDGVAIFQGMADHTAESIKSLEGFKRAWVEEAQSLSDRSMTLLRPTIRAPGSQLWFSWNPRRKVDPVDLMLRGPEPPTGAVVVKANWRDNPWFPAELEQERQDCLRTTPDQYDHIWEGGYATIVSGAYYAKQLAMMKAEGRLGRVTADPLMRKRAFFDIGGTGAKADACSIWVCQFVGREIRVLDYYEAKGQPLASHVLWLQGRGYRPNNTDLYLPHDGATQDKVFAVSYESALQDAGYDVTVIPNQGKGAASIRIESARRIFNRIWINELTTGPGVEALGAYHARRDEQRLVDLGPEHDWCFTGDTEILTRYGTHRMMDLPQSGEVLTLCGWKPYRNPRITRRRAPLVAVAFSDGLTVRCTPDHLFLTDSGWISAERLTPGTLIQSSLTRSRSISMAVSTAFGKASATTREAASRFIATLGRAPLVRSLRAATSTIVTAIPLTIGSLTSNAYLRLSTYPALGTRPGETSNRGGISARQPERKPPSGTPPKKEGFGTADTPSGLRAGRSGGARSELASLAPPSSTPSFARAGTLKSIARRSAKRLRIVSVERLSEQADVWCLTVPESECFSLSNGAVVHNCSHAADAFGMMCVAYEEPNPASLRPRSAYDTGYGSSRGSSWAV